MKVRLNYENIKIYYVSRGGGDFRLIGGQEARRSRGQAIYVILNLFQDLVFKSKEANRHRSKANLEGRRRYDGRLLTPIFFPLLGKDNRMGNDVISKNPYSKKSCNLNMSDGTATFPPISSLIKEEKSDTIPSLNRKCKAAFTLAEVLITLGIIGVVAAMTMPTTIAKFQHKALETAFKKTYSSLMQAMIYAEPELIFDITGGGVVGDNSEFYKKLWEKYNVVKNLNENDQYAMDKLYNSLGGIKTYSKKQEADVGCPQKPQLMAADGTSVGGLYNCGSLWVSIDVNGPYKKPNALGNDIFYFGIDADSKRLFPLGMDKVHGYLNLSAQERYCSINSTDARNGWGCTVFALANKCPDDDSKTYWECLP